eukprot:m51a1_g3094 hypothetical protein (904) ;mRNA; r:96386-100190
MAETVEGSEPGSSGQSDHEPSAHSDNSSKLSVTDVVKELLDIVEEERSRNALLERERDALEDMCEEERANARFAESLREQAVQNLALAMNENERLKATRPNNQDSFSGEKDLRLKLVVESGRIVGVHMQPPVEMLVSAVTKSRDFLVTTFNDLEEERGKRAELESTTTDLRRVRETLQENLNVSLHTLAHAICERLWPRVQLFEVATNEAEELLEASAKRWSSSFSRGNPGCVPDILANVEQKAQLQAFCDKEGCGNLVRFLVQVDKYAKQCNASFIFFAEQRKPESSTVIPVPLKTSGNAHAALAPKAATVRPGHAKNDITRTCSDLGAITRQLQSAAVTGQSPQPVVSQRPGQDARAAARRAFTLRRAGLGNGVDLATPMPLYGTLHIRKRPSLQQLLVAGNGPKKLTAGDQSKSRSSSSLLGLPGLPCSDTGSAQIPEPLAEAKRPPQKPPAQPVQKPERSTSERALRDTKEKEKEKAKEHSLGRSRTTEKRSEKTPHREHDKKKDSRHGHEHRKLTSSDIHSDPLKAREVLSGPEVSPSPDRANKPQALGVALKSVLADVSLIPGSSSSPLETPRNVRDIGATTSVKLPGPVTAICQAGNCVWAAVRGSVSILLAEDSKVSLRFPYSTIVQMEHVGDVQWVALEDFQIGIIDSRNPQYGQVMPAHAAPIVAFLRVRGKLWSVSSDETACVWDTQLMRLHKKVSLGSGMRFCDSKTRRMMSSGGPRAQPAVMRMVLAKDEVWVLCTPSLINVWDANKRVAKYTVPVADVTNLSSLGEMIWTTHSDGSVRVWDRKTRQCSRELRSHRGAVTCISVVQGYSIRVWTGSDDGEIVTWETGLSPHTLAELQGAQDAACMICGQSVKGLITGVLHCEVCDSFVVHVKCAPLITPSMCCSAPDAYM